MYTRCISQIRNHSSRRYTATSRAPPPLCSGHGSILTSTRAKPSFSSIRVLAGLAVCAVWHQPAHIPLTASTLRTPSAAAPHSSTVRTTAVPTPRPWTAGSSAYATTHPSSFHRPRSPTYAPVPSDDGEGAHLRPPLALESVHRRGLRAEVVVDALARVGAREGVRPAMAPLANAGVVGDPFLY